MKWGPAPNAPSLTLVGKGVCFDTGGLDIKPRTVDGADEEGHGRRRQRAGTGVDDHGAKLPVRLRVLIPAVDNNVICQCLPAIGDVLPSRNGMTVEIGNTDAEGRLVLADALTSGR